MSGLDATQRKLVITAEAVEQRYWRDLWRYRELFYFLAWRDLLVRYKQTAVGVGWALLRPLLTMLILAVIFGRVAKLPSDGVPYPLLVLAAMLPWQFFSNALADSSASLVANANLISKVYFPRLIIPLSAIVVGFVDFMISFAILAALFAWYSFLPSWRMLTLPLFVLFAFVTALGPGLLITALNVKYRDFRYIIPFVVQFGLYVSPVAYASSAIPEHFRLLYAMNPMVGVIDGFRWAICGTTGIFWSGFAVSAASSTLLLCWGLIYFRRMERTFADVV